MKKISIIPNWSASAEIIILALQNPKLSKKGLDEAIFNIRDMANKFDKYINQNKKIINQLEKIIEETKYSNYDDYEPDKMSASEETIYFDRGRLFVANFILWDLKNER